MNREKPDNPVLPARGRGPGVIRGKRWLLRRRWANLDGEERQTLRAPFALNHRVAKAYLLKEQLAQLRSRRVRSDHPQTQAGSGAGKADAEAGGNGHGPRG